MALRQQDLAYGSGGMVLRFPTARARARARRAHRLAAVRRLSVFILGSVIAAGMLLSGPGGAVASRPSAPRAVRIGAGQTIWDLAERYAPSDVDPRAYVDTVLEANGIDAGVSAGTWIRLP